MPRLTVGQENGAAAEKRSDRFVVGLDEVGGDDLHITGGKAAALAKATRAGLSTLPGWVLTTSFCEAVDAGQDVATHAAVRDVYELAGGGARALVARSSSVVEDSAESSMAGRFESVIGIVGFEAFVKAVVTVLDSRAPGGGDGSSDRGAGAAVDRAGVRWRPVRRRPGHRAERSPGCLRGCRRPGAVGEWRGRWIPFRARRLRQTAADGHVTGAVAPQGRAAAAVGSLVTGRGSVRVAAGRRVGRRYGWGAVAAAVPAGDDRDPGRSVGSRLRARPHRRDVPGTADRVGARPLGSSAA